MSVDILYSVGDVLSLCELATSQPWETVATMSGRGAHRKRSRRFCFSRDRHAMDLQIIPSCFQSTIRCIGNLTLTHARVTISAQDLDLWTVRVHGKSITQPIARQMRDVVSCISTTTRDFRCYFNGGVIDQGRGCAELSARSLSSLFHIIVCLG